MPTVARRNLASRVLAETGQVLPGHFDRARRRLLQPGEQHQQARFTGTGRPDDANGLARPHFQVDAGQDVDQPGRRRHRQAKAADAYQLRIRL